MKSILFHVQHDDQLDVRLQLALSLARATGGHLSCLHTTPIQSFVAFDSFGGVYASDEIIRRIDEEEAKLRADVEARLATAGGSWDYRQATGNVADSIIGCSALADVVIVGRPAFKHEFDGLSVGVLGDLLERGRTPLLVASRDQRPFDPGRSVLIAWNGSYEAANAVRAAVPLLKLAQKVEVVRYIEGKRENFPFKRVLDYLSCHGIEATYRESKVDLALVTSCLIADAAAVDAPYLVTGAYSRSRLGEFLLGGATRELLSDAPMPLFMAH